MSQKSDEVVENERPCEAKYEADVVDQRESVESQYAAEVVEKKLFTDFQ